MTHANVLPARAGIGLKGQHAAALMAAACQPAFVEIHAENYMGDGGPAHRQLARLRESMALSIHGVGLSIGGAGALDSGHLARLARLLERHPPAAFSEHLAWSSHGGNFYNDLLPIAYDEVTLARVCAHIDEVQDRLGRRMLLENPATYVEYCASTVAEAEFIAEVVRRTGCGLLLDVNNAYVSCVNHGRDPRRYLAALPLAQVGEIHLAGFAADVDGAGAPLLIDNHGSPVADAVWQLYREVLNETGPVATLIEWDNNVPPLATLLGEARRADALLREAAAPGLAA